MKMIDGNFIPFFGIILLAIGFYLAQFDWRVILVMPFGMLALYLIEKWMYKK